MIFGGGTGADAADLTAIDGGDVASIAHTGTGLYTITLRTAYPALCFFSASLIDTTAALAWRVECVEEKVATDKTIKIIVTNEAGSVGGDANTKFIPTDLTTDERLLFMAVCKTAE